MASVDKVILIGNLTRDPEVKYLANGTAVAEVGLATNRRWKTDSGEEKEDVCFFNCTIWGKQAEAAGKYLKKGKSVYFEGHHKLDQWEDKQTGAKRSALKIIVERMQFLGSKADGEGGGASSEGRQSHPRGGEAQSDGPDLNNDDIPF